VAKFRTFLIHPVPGNTPFYRVLIYPTYESMAKGWKRRRKWSPEDAQTVFTFEAVTHRDNHYECDGNGRRKLPQLGEIYLYADGVTHDTVTHEMTHAALHSLPPSASSRPVMDADERIAERCGLMCAEFWRKWNRQC
jgi:hypothetical protein